jgi:hypothetical protein
MRDLILGAIYQKRKADEHRNPIAVQKGPPVAIRFISFKPDVQLSIGVKLPQQSSVAKRRSKSPEGNCYFPLVELRLQQSFAIFVASETSLSCLFVRPIVNLGSSMHNIRQVKTQCLARARYHTKEVPNNPPRIPWLKLEMSPRQRRRHACNAPMLGQRGSCI